MKGYLLLKNLLSSRTTCMRLPHTLCILGTCKVEIGSCVYCSQKATSKAAAIRGLQRYPRGLGARSLTCLFFPSYLGKPRPFLSHPISGPLHEIPRISQSPSPTHCGVGRNSRAKPHPDPELFPQPLLCAEGVEARDGFKLVIASSEVFVVSLAHLFGQFDCGSLIL
jgi:hypothetical protein